jgi:hypothetical protein
MPKPPSNSFDAVPDRLKVIHEQYGSLLNLGVTSAAGTLVFMLQALVLNKEFRELATAHRSALDHRLLIAGLILTAVALVLFILTKLQLHFLFERKYLGDKLVIARYFSEELDSDVSLPLAVQQRRYMQSLDRSVYFWAIEHLTECYKFFAVLSLVVGWVTTLVYLWPLLPR